MARINARVPSEEIISTTKQSRTMRKEQTHLETLITASHLPMDGGGVLWKSVTSAPGLQNLGRLTKELIRHYILWTNLPVPWRTRERGRDVGLGRETDAG
ncbi:hypothetical protein AVEN_195363-1 [Araneus ventricosus]|uniref:Uncharacterized protein n=1 Tax=Araneus ventricosus TaxID=182803 RepID=A0A4Y2DJ64_ARAVE|nr:hypothetical protein AVEN_195363-1 [Araneus ventricosus]